MALECLIQNFKQIFQEKVGRQKIVDEEHILNYYQASKRSLHGILQYVLIHAGIICGFVSVPEYKIRFKEPLKKLEIDARLKQYARSSRSQQQIRVDVAFLKDSNLEGVGEVYTLDEVHGVLPSRELDTPWLTPYHKLRHMTEDERCRGTKFLVIANVLPKNLPQHRLPWKDSRKHTMKDWENSWRDFAKELSKKLDVGHVIIYEDGVQSEIYKKDGGYPLF